MEIHMNYSILSNRMKLPEPEISVSEVIFDKKKEKRYLLEKRWDKDGEVLCAFMMNPSHASHILSDRTVDQLVKYAENNGYGSLIVVNAISFIEPQSNNLKNSTIHTFDPINWSFIEKAFIKSDHILFATGYKGQQALYKFIDSKNSQVINILKKYRKQFYCYDIKLSARGHNFYYTPHLRPQFHKKPYYKKNPKPLLNFPNYKKIFRE